MKRKTIGKGHSFRQTTRSFFPPYSTKGSHSRRRASILVEFALIVPVLLAIVMGIIEFGWQVRNHLTVANAAREGARYASVGKRTTDIIARIRGMAATIPGAPNSLTITIYRNDGASGITYSTIVGDTATTNNAPTGSLIRIQVSAPNRSLTGLFPFLNNRTLKSEVVMRREA